MVIIMMIIHAFSLPPDHEVQSRKASFSSESSGEDSQSQPRVRDEGPVPQARVSSEGAKPRTGERTSSESGESSSGDSESSSGDSDNVKEEVPQEGSSSSSSSESGDEEANKAIDIGDSMGNAKIAGGDTPGVKEPVKTMVGDMPGIVTEKEQSKTHSTSSESSSEDSEDSGASEEDSGALQEVERDRRINANPPLSSARIPAEGEISNGRRDAKLANLTEEKVSMIK